MKKDENTSPMKRIMTLTLTVSSVLYAAFAVLYYSIQQGWMLTCAVTCGIIAYHMLIRFLSPVILHLFFHKRYNPESGWFRQKKWERALYRLLRVKSWKGGIATYDPREFSMKLHSLDEIVNNMCHAEAVHELIILLSFTSLLFAIPFGAFPVFLLTSIGAAGMDSVFVIVQRYNRPRVMQLMRHENKGE